MRARILAASVAVVLSAASAYADGFVTGADVVARKPRRPAEAPVDPVIPDQRALIVHRDGREKLVIETAFVGRGTDFAWIVPTPSVPKIEEASTELFARLSDATRPELVSQVPDLGIAGAVVVVGLLFARHGGKRGRRAAKSLVAGAAAFALFVQGGLLRQDGAPPLIAAAGLDVALPTTPAETQVDVRRREVVGAFDTVTLAAKDARSLVDWLGAHGYTVPAALEPAAAEYVREGWVFNAMRLRRDGDRTDAVRISPLMFTFDAAAPVYPMRLTGVGAAPVRVELYVAGDGRAEARGFDVSRCAMIDKDGRHVDDAGRLVIADAADSALLGGATVLTRLDRTFSPEAMKTDVAVTQSPFEDSQRTVFSKTAATALAWNAGALLAIGAFIGLASAASAASGRRPVGALRRWTATTLVLVLALDAGLAVAAFAPTVPTRPVHVGR